MADAGGSGPPRRRSPLPALILCIKGMRLRAPLQPPLNPDQPPAGRGAAGGGGRGGARLGESKHDGEEGEARWQAPGARWKSRRGEGWNWRRDGEGPLSAPHHPPSPCSPFYFCHPDPLHLLIQGTLSSDSPPFLQPHRFTFSPHPPSNTGGPCAQRAAVSGYEVRF